VKARILFLAQLLPYPPVCGGTIRSFNILKRLCSNYDVTLLTFTRRQEDERHAEFLRGICSEVRTVPMLRSGARNAEWALKSMVKGSSFIIDRDFVKQMQDEVDNTLADGHFDLIYIDHLQMFQYVKGKQAWPRLLDEHNLEWRIIQRVANIEHGPHKWFASREWPKLRAYELSACLECDAVSTVTEHDQMALQTEDSRLKHVSCVPIGVDTSKFRPVDMLPESKTVVSIATMSWPPNIDSMLHFASDIFPSIKRRVPDARLVIAGGKPPDSIKRLESDPFITVPGFVEDIHELARQSAVFVVPLRAGSGMRVKILNAMAMGLPVVSTGVGCEGIEVTHGQNVLLADTAEEFSRQVCDLLTDVEKRIALGAAARNFVVENYSWEVIYPKLDWLVESVLDRSRSKAPV
jgi:sugar transferase (PEP-CTERM/EpsH1 system associated)